MSQKTKHSIVAYLSFFFLTCLSMLNVQPTSADPSGGQRRAIVKARPYDESLDERTVSDPPTFLLPPYGNRPPKE